MIAVMAKYNPFAEKASMQKIAQQQAVESVSMVSQMLSELGFNLHLIGSERYVWEKLESLNAYKRAKRLSGSASVLRRSKGSL